MFTCGVKMEKMVIGKKNKNIPENDKEIIVNKNNFSIHWNVGKLN